MGLSKQMVRVVTGSSLFVGLSGIVVAFYFTMFVGLVSGMASAVPIIADGACVALIALGLLGLWHISRENETALLVAYRPQLKPVA